MIALLLGIFPAAPFHLLLKNLPTCRTVFGYASLPEKTVHPQPDGPAQNGVGPA